MTQDQLKKAAAQAAIPYVQPDTVIGVGTGSTVDFFIAELASIRRRIEGAVASSVATEKRLREYRIPILDLNSTGPLPLYVDGADQATRHRQLVKGGGGALTREKVLASASDKFICILDNTKLVAVLGAFPVAVEVIPMARSAVARKLVQLGGDPVYRKSFLTDNGNPILDVYNLEILDPARLETDINNIPGVVSCGIFAHRRADLLLVASADGVEEVRP